MTRLAYILMMVILFASAIQIASAQQEELTVHVITPDGVGKAGIVVNAVAGNFSQVFVTNSTGWATFRNLPPGRYNITITSANILLNWTSVNFPQQTHVSLVAPLGELAVTVLDLAGRPVGEISVRLSSAKGTLERTLQTSSEGVAVFSDLPYSSLEGVGGHFRAEAVSRAVVVGEENVTLTSPQVNATVTAKLLNLNITVTNLEGLTPTRRLKVFIESSKFNQTYAASEGRVSAEQLISSELVGPYRISVMTTLSDKEVVVYEEERTLRQDLNITLVANLGKLSMKVMDEDGQPLPRMRLLFSSELAGNFSAVRTASNGTAKLVDIPLSTTGAGKYTVYVYRSATFIGKTEVELTTPSQSALFTVKLTPVHITVTDYMGRPLAGANVTLSDPLTGRVTAALTDSNGRTIQRAFAGPNLVGVVYKGVSVLSTRVNVADKPVILNLPSVNFPVKVKVLDALNTHVSGLDVSITADGDALFQGKLTGSPITTTVELPSYIRVDVKNGENLVARETVYANGPAEVEVRLVPFISVAGFLVPVDLIIFAVSVLVLAALLGYLVRGFIVARQR